MEDALEKLTKSVKDLQIASRLFNIWTFLVAIILAVVYGINFLYPSLFSEPIFFSVIIAMVYFIIILLLFLIYWLTKDNQRQIMILVIRALLGFLLPITLLIFGMSLWVKILAIVFVIISFILFYLVFTPVKTMMDLQKQFQTP